MVSASSFPLWQSELFDLSNHFEVLLVGLAGRLKMNPDWSIEGVRLPSHLFYTVVEGAFEAQIDGVNRTLNPGDLVWVGPDTRFWFRIAKPDLVVLRFRLDARRQNGETIPAPQPIQTFLLESGSHFLVERLIEAANAPTPDKAATRAYLSALSCELERSTLPPPASGILTPAQCEAVRQCLSRSRGQWPSTADLASAAELSPPYFTRLFTQTFKRSPRRFLLEERMRLATVRVLESSTSVSQIARDLGYADVFTFSRQFKSVVGQSPSAYRAAHSMGSLPSS